MNIDFTIYLSKIKFMRSDKLTIYVPKDPFCQSSKNINHYLLNESHTVIYFHAIYISIFH